MRFELMFPDQIRKAIKENRPVVLPLGVLEYHGEHSVMGVDTLLVIKTMELLEKEIDMVILPPFYYGAASYVVESPENGKGSIHVPSEVLNIFGRHVFSSLLRTGFRNIHCFIHHQSENFIAGMPTDLAFKLAARQATFDFLENERGEDWWGRDDMQNYYSDHEAQTDPFSWIRLHPLLDAEIQKEFPIDHTGKQEISLMMAFYPEGVDMNKHQDEKWYSRSAKEANLAYGNAAKDKILKSLKSILAGGNEA
ncbi:MAG: creatininase family protein [bacterium]|nr:creatininase family protein [bacterium]